MRPAPPLAKRLNRNALTVAAALAGVTVLTVVVVTRPARPSSAGELTPQLSQSTPPVPARPSFLDQPPRTPPVHPDTSSAHIVDDVGRAAPSHGTHGIERSSGLPVPPPIVDSTPSPPVVSGSTAGDGHTGANLSPRYVSYQAALASRVLVDPRGWRGQSAAGRADGIDDATVVGLRESPFARGPDSGSRTGPSTVVSRLTPTAGAIALDSAGSSFTVRAGTVVPGLLMTGVNSDLPGEVLGQTTRDVFDSRTQELLLIPRGSRLIGSYDNRSVGTGRLIVSWTRLILPDGRSMTLPRLAGTDPQGQTGLHDGVDHHYGRVYGAALLISALTAGVQLSQPQQSGIYAAPSSRQVAAGALGQTMGDVALESARRGLDVLPTIVIRPGQPFDVFLTGDLTFPGAYAQTPGN
jgi:type IV secretory pathway VirB10-like protein